MSHPLRKVLVVEDEPVISSAIRVALQRRGHDVAVAGSAEEALELPAPDVLLTDLILPGISGLELCAGLSEQGAPTQVVLITGMATLEDCRRAMQLGVCDIISKPFRLQEIVQVVERLPSAARKPAGEEPRGLRRTCSATEGGAVGAVRELLAFAMACGLTPSARARVGSACAEIADNAARHAFAHSRGSFELEADYAPGELSVRFRDRGCGFDPVDAVIGPGDDRARSGLARVAALCEQVHLDTRPGEGTEVVLSFVTRPVLFDSDTLVDLSELDYLTPRISRRALETLADPEAEDLLQLSPALAVVMGRLLTKTTAAQKVHAALWS